MSSFTTPLVALALVILSVSKADGRRPQEPEPPYPYYEEEVIFQNEKDGVRLAGTLSLPLAKGKFPAVVLVTGSGPQDRNETEFGHRPFLVLADHLTRLGIAVLRVDDRGVGRSTGNFSEATSEDFADDALAAVKFLRTRREIAPGKIGLLGHSEGGLVAPLAAAQSSDVAFVVMMAGPGLKGDQVIIGPGGIDRECGWLSAQLIVENRAAQERIFSIIKQDQDLKLAEAGIRKEAEIFVTLAGRIKAEAPESERKTAATVAAVIEGQAQLFLSRWFRFYLTYDPTVALMKLKCPVLAVNGEKDIEVPARENLEAIRRALAASGNKDYTVLMLPGLNHLFQTAETGAISEYEQIEETISPLALDAVSDWILKHTSQKAHRSSNSRVVSTGASTL
jgi:fermentation-respiration switch protein FrsA (DUF1100 family)